MKLHKKIVLALAAVIGVLILYWNPLYIAFCLFKSVMSYYCRFSYLTIFILLFIAAEFFASVELKKKNIWIPVVSGFILAGIYLIIYVKKADKYPMSGLMAAVMGITGVIIMVSMVLYSRSGR